MEKDLETMRQFMEAVYPLDDETWQILSRGWQPVTFKRKTIITAAGETERHMYFVTEGIQRAFFLGPQDRREATIMFSYSPSFSGVLDSFLTQTPSPFYLETLTASRMLRMGHDNFMQMQQDHPLLKDLFFQLLAHAVKGILLRQAEIQCYTAEEKFRSFLARSPHMLNLVPHKYLASYLSIDPSTFSRLLATVKL